jgi:hypothetical protein
VGVDVPAPPPEPDTGGESPPTPQPPADTSAPRVAVVVGRGPLAARGGAVTIKLGVCPPDERSCRVTVTLKAGKVVLGSATTTLTPGRSAGVRVKLTKKGRALLAKRKRVRASVEAVVRDGAGNSASATHQVTLR